jgi:type IX secretion system PorP/SprF family membrane protein
VNTQAIASYSYHILLGENRKISFGLRGGFSNYSVDYSELQIDGSDPQFQENISDVNPVVGSGMIYSSDHFFLSVSVPNMLKTSITMNGTESVFYNQHAYALIAYGMQVTSRLKLRPFMLARAVQGTAVNFDLGATLTADDSYSIGIFSRRLHTYGAMVRMNIGDILRVGYIFELPTNRSVGVNYITHEFTVGLRMSLWESHALVAASF